MRVWILGSNGMLGKAFVRYLKGHVDLLTTTRDEVNISCYEAIEAFAKEHKPDLWINCTGYTKVDLAQQEPQLAFNANSEGPYQLGLCAKRLRESSGINPNIIHFSTDYVFDGNHTEPYRETDTTHPINVYGKSKLEGEQRLAKIYDRHLIFRLSWLFGNEGNHFVKSMLDLMQKNEIVRVVDDQVGRPTYCEDVVRLVWELQTQSGLFHLCNSEPVSWHGFAQEIAHQAHIIGIEMKVQLIEPISTYEFHRPAPRPIYSVLNTDKIESLGVHLRPWSQALQQCLQANFQRS